MQKHAGENIVLQAVMDEFEEMREKGNLTAHLLNREKVSLDNPDQESSWINLISLICRTNATRR